MLLSQTDIDNAIGKLLGEARAILSSEEISEAECNRLRNIKGALKWWRQRHPTSAATAARLDRIATAAGSILADLRSAGADENFIDEISRPLDEATRIISWDFPLAVGTLGLQCRRLTQALTNADVDPIAIREFIELIENSIVQS